MNGLHANICVLWIGAVQAKRVTFLFNGSLYGKKIKMSVTSAYIECATGNWYHRIELTDSFLLKYRYWTFTANASRKKFWTSDIATSYIFSLNARGVSTKNFIACSMKSAIVHTASNSLLKGCMKATFLQSILGLRMRMIPCTTPCQCICAHCAYR